MNKENKSIRGENIETSKTKTKTYLCLKIVAIVLALAIIFGSLSHLKNIMSNGNSSHNSLSKLSSNEYSPFMRYEGPIFPVMINSENPNPNINIERKLVYDFYGANEINSSVKLAFIKDQYYIKNAGEENQIKLLYPFVSSIVDMYYSYPRISQDGKELEIKLHYGNSPGNFVSTDNENLSKTVNHRDYRYWEDYKQILNEDAYLNLAYAPAADVKNIPVTVYSFTNSYYPESSKVENPTLVAGVEIDRSKSTVLTLGFDGFAKFDENNEEFYQYSIPKKNQSSITDDKHYLIIIGEDSPSLNIETQSIGGWDGYEKKFLNIRNNLEGTGADINRKEMCLDEALELTLPILYKYYRENQMAREVDFSNWKLNEHNVSSYTISYEEFKELYIKELFEKGILSKKPMTRYEDGSLESFDVINLQRIIFAELEIDLTSKEMTELEISSYKQGSYDFYGDRYDRKIFGYDLLTNIDSAVAVDRYEVEIIDYNKVDIVKQNLGLDLEKDIRKVNISKDRPHYFMEIIKENNK